MHTFSAKAYSVTFCKRCIQPVWVGHDVDELRDTSSSPRTASNQWRSGRELLAFGDNTVDLLVGVNPRRILPEFTYR